MGGKRPDQYNIDPGEAGATDYKNLPQTGRGSSNLDDTVELDRQKLAQDRATSSVPAPGARPAPSVHTRYGKPVEAGESEAETPLGGETGEADGGNPLA